MSSRYSSVEPPTLSLIISAVILVIIIALWISSANGGLGVKDRAATAVETAGYSDVELGDYQWFSCSSGDWAGWSFTALDRDEHTINGYVCCGLLKACTVRY